MYMSFDSGGLEFNGTIESLGVNLSIRTSLAHGTKLTRGRVLAIWIERACIRRRTDYGQEVALTCGRCNS
jgi:hypothetical protein